MFLLQMHKIYMKKYIKKRNIVNYLVGNLDLKDRRKRSLRSLEISKFFNIELLKIFFYLI